MAGNNNALLNKLNEMYLINARNIKQGNPDGILWCQSLRNTIEKYQYINRKLNESEVCDEVWKGVLEMEEK